ncbi:F(420)H(2) dehydrogenase subunit M [uncultured archaeon]|nr:F(420)H(2) dehydrogenase subunit M [uncultured archaeon]
MLPLLPVIVLVPILFILPLLILDERHSFKIAIASSTAVLALVAFAAYTGITSGFAPLSFSMSYIASLGISTGLALTRYSNILLVMSAIVLFAVSLVARNFIKESARAYNILFLLISCSTLGLFLSGGFFLFFVFWEFSEIAMFFMIYLFGGIERRYAATKFLVYSAIASMSLLLGILLLYANVPAHTFDISAIALQASAMPPSVQLAALLLLSFAFMIKMPVFPLHSWLPDAYAEAPANGGMLLSGVMSKFGAYGFLVMLTTLPIASHFTIYFAVLFGFSAVYGAFVAIRQANFRRLVAYASFVEMGIAAFGLASMNALATAGAMYALLGQGLVMSLLFLVAGSVDESFGTSLIGRIKGVIRSFPGLSYVLVFATFALVGLPLTAGFIGDLLIFTGAFQAHGAIGLAPLAALVILGAFMFYVMEKSFFNVSEAIEPYQSPGASVYAAMAILIAATVVFGAMPSLLLSPFAI